MKKIFSAIVFLMLVALPSWVAAEELIEGWRLELTPYVWGISIDGKSGIGNVPLLGEVTTEIDMDLKDIINNMDSAFLVAFSGSKGPWDLWIDTNYLKLTEKTTTYRMTAKTKMEQLLMDAMVSYRVAQTDNVDWCVHGGIRYADIDTKTTALGFGPMGIPLSFNIGDKWYDPIIGARAKWFIDDQWTLTGRAEVGGFGVGCDLTWLASAAVNYQINDMWSVKGMYRMLGMDYSDGFVSDMTVQGLAVGFGVAF